MGAGLEGGQLLADIEKRGYTLENSLGLGEVGKGALKAVFYWVLSQPEVTRTLGSRAFPKSASPGV